MEKLKFDNTTIIIIVLVSLLVGLWSWRLFYSKYFEKMTDNQEQDTVIGLEAKYTDNHPNLPQRCRTCTDIKDAHVCFSCPNCAWDIEKQTCYNCGKNCDCENLPKNSCLKSYHCYLDQDDKCKKCDCSDPNTPCVSKSCSRLGSVEKNDFEPIECGYCRNINEKYKDNPEKLKEVCNKCGSCYYSKLGCVLVHLPSANKENQGKCHNSKCKTLSRGDCEACPYCNFDVGNSVCYNPNYDENAQDNQNELRNQLDKCSNNLTNLNKEFNNYKDRSVALPKVKL